MAPAFQSLDLQSGQRQWTVVGAGDKTGVQAVQLFSASTCILVSGHALKSSLNSRLGRLPKKTVKKTSFLALWQAPLQTSSRGAVLG